MTDRMTTSWAVIYWLLLVMVLSIRCVALSVTKTSIPTIAEADRTKYNYFRLLLNEEVQIELLSQRPNEAATPYDFAEGHLQPRTQLRSRGGADAYPAALFPTIRHSHLELFSLDDLFPCLDFSETFNSCENFRDELRQAIRYDMVVEDAHSIYKSMTVEQRKAELARNTPLIGLWKVDVGVIETGADIVNTHVQRNKTTQVLRQYLGKSSFGMPPPTGQEFLHRIGSLSNSSCAPYHWTEIVGVAATQNHKMGDKTQHAWHQDYGCLECLESSTCIYGDGDSNYGKRNCYGNNKHVFLGFPCENNYRGTGVFPHLIPLQREQWAQRVNGGSEKPIFYQGHVSEKHIVLPSYTPGKEIIVFRDIDVLHSTPDIQYRSSIMRFG